MAGIDPNVLIGIVATIAGAVMAVYVALEKKISNIDTRLQAVEKQDDKIVAKLDDLVKTQDQRFQDLVKTQDQKFQELKNEITELKIQLKTKL